MRNRKSLITWSYSRLRCRRLFCFTDFKYFCSGLFESAERSEAQLKIKSLCFLYMSQILTVPPQWLLRVALLVLWSDKQTPWWGTWLHSSRIYYLFTTNSNFWVWIIPVCVCSVPTFQSLPEETLSKLADVMEEVSLYPPPRLLLWEWACKYSNQMLSSGFRLIIRMESTSSDREPEETPSSSSAKGRSVHPPLRLPLIRFLVTDLPVHPHPIHPHRWMWPRGIQPPSSLYTSGSSSRETGLEREHYRGKVTWPKYVILLR